MLVECEVLIFFLYIFFCKIKKNTISPLFDASRNKNIGATIHIGQEIRWFPYAGFFLCCFGGEGLVFLLNCLKSPFLAQRPKNVFPEGQNPLQDLEEGPLSRPFFLSSRYFILLYYPRVNDTRFSDGILKLVIIDGTTQWGFQPFAEAFGNFFFFLPFIVVVNIYTYIHIFIYVNIVNPFTLLKLNIS